MQQRAAALGSTVLDAASELASARKAAKGSAEGLRAASAALDRRVGAANARAKAREGDSTSDATPRRPSAAAPGQEAVGQVAVTAGICMATVVPLGSSLPPAQKLVETHVVLLHRALALPAAGFTRDVPPFLALLEY